MFQASWKLILYTAVVTFCLDAIAALPVTSISPFDQELDVFVPWTDVRLNAEAASIGLSSSNHLERRGFRTWWQRKYNKSVYIDARVRKLQNEKDLQADLGPRTRIQTQQNLSKYTAKIKELEAKYGYTDTDVPKEWLKHPELYDPWNGVTHGVTN